MSDYRIGLVGQIDVAETRKTIDTQLKTVSKVMPSVDLKINTDKSFKDLKTILVDSSSVVQQFNNEGKLMKATFTGIDQETQQTVKVMQKLDVVTGELANTMVTLSQSTGKTDEDFDKLNKRMIDIKDRANSMINVMSHYGNKDQIAQAKAWNSQLQSMTDISKKGVGEADSLAKKISNLSTEVKASGKNALNLGEAWRSAFRSFTLYSSITVLYYAVVRAIKAGVDMVTELDTAMTELNKVTDLTAGELDQVAKNAEVVSENMHVATSEVIKATAAFARMGYEAKQALDLAEQAILLKNVGDDISSIDDATSVLISTLKGFSMGASEATKVVDALNSTSNNYAVTTGQLAEGIKRVAGVASTTGASFEQTLGLLTAMTEVSQNAEKSSTALRTLALRIQGLEEDGSSLEANFTAKLNEDFEKIAGVSIMVDGKLRNIYDIVVDLGGAWSGLTKEQQVYLSIQAAGVRQSSEFINLISHAETAVKATETAMNSYGSALIENEKYLNSIEGKTANFSATLERLWTHAINSNLIKNVVDFASSILTLVDNFGLLNTVLVATGTYLAVTNPLLSAIAFAIVGISKVTDSLITTSTELREEIARLNDELQTDEDRLESLLRKRKEGVEVDEDEIERLKIRIDLQKQVIDLKKKEEAEKTYNDSQKEITSLTQKYNYLREEIDGYTDALHQGVISNEEYAAYTETLDNTLIGVKEDMIILLDTLISTSDYLEGDAKTAVDETILNFSKWLGITKSVTDGVTKQSAEIYKLTTALSQSNTIIEHAQKSTETLKKTQEDAENIVQKLADGYKYQGFELIELLDTYPQLNKYLNKNNELSITKAQLIEELVGAQKSMTIQTLKNDKDELESKKILLKGQIEYFEKYLEIAESLITLNAEINGQSISEATNVNIDDARKSLISAKKGLVEVNSSIEEINRNMGILSTNFGGVYAIEGKEDKTDILSQFKAQQNAVSDLSYELGILGEKLKWAEGEDKVKIQDEIIAKYKAQKEAVHQYSNALRELRDKGGLSADDLEKVNKQLQGNGTQWWAIDSAIKEVAKTMSEEYVKSLEDAINKQEELTAQLVDELKSGIEDLNDELQNEIDALDAQQKLQEQLNEDLDNQIKRQELLAKIQEKQLEIAKAKAELENIQNNKNVRMLNAEGTAFTFIADPKAIADKNDEIAKLNEDLVGATQDLKQHDLEVARELAKREVEIEKQKLQDRIDQNKEYLKEVEDITKQSLDNQTSLWATFASNVNSELRGVIANIIQALNAQAELEGKITGNTTVVPTPTTVLGTGVSGKKGFNFDSIYNTTPSVVPTNTSTSSTTNNSPITIGTIVLPNVNNGNSFVSQLRTQIITNN